MLDGSEHNSKTVQVPPAGFSRASANEYFTVFEHAEQRVVLAQRVPNGPVGNDQLRMIVWALESLLVPHLHGWSLVVDTRYAAGTNDPRFEQDLIDWIGRASQHFVRFAVLVKTQAGVNQAARHTAKAANGLATLDEAMAHAWARGPRA